MNLTSIARREFVKTDEGWYRAEVPPYSAAPLAPAGAQPGLASSGDTLSNGILTLRFDPASGEIQPARRR